MSMSDYMKGLRRKVGTQLLEVPSVSVAVRDDEGRLLLVRHREQGRWMTPGGAVEPLETPADAAVREIFEETGLEVELTRILGVYGGPEFLVRYGNGDEVSYLIVLFEGRCTGGNSRPDGDEILEVRYFRRQELAGLEFPPWMSEVLEAVYETHVGFRRPSWRPGVRI